MDIFFADPSEVRLPPDKVRIRELRVEPLPDGRRLRVYLEVDPFEKRPSAELIIVDQAGQEVAAANIVESMSRKMGLTMHLRNEQTAGHYQLRASLLYAAFAEGEQPDQEWKPVEQKVVDTAQVEFEVPENP
jgi:hypothetical protein